MAIRFGGEYDQSSTTLKVSTIEARIFFLNLLYRERPDVIDDFFKLSPVQLEMATLLFGASISPEIESACDVRSLASSSPEEETILSALVKYLRDNFKRHQSLKQGYIGDLASLRAVPVISAEKLLEDLLPLWSELGTNQYEISLRNALVSWAERWNLNADWILDLASGILRNFISEIWNPLIEKSGNDEFDFRIFSLVLNNWILTKSGWHDAMPALQLESSEKQLRIAEKQKVNRMFTYCRDGLDIKLWWFPTWDGKNKFREEAIEKCKLELSKLSADKRASESRVLKEYGFKLDQFMKSCLKKAGPSLSATPRKNSGELQFHWFIQFQIPPNKNYTQLANEHSVTIPTMREGIRSIGDLMGLMPRPTVHSGRQRGSGTKKTSIHFVSRKGVTKPKNP
jgi:hypothetical protein